MIGDGTGSGGLNCPAAPSRELATKWVELWLAARLPQVDGRDCLIDVSSVSTKLPVVADGRQASRAPARPGWSLRRRPSPGLGIEAAGSVRCATSVGSRDLPRGAAGSVSCLVTSRTVFMAPNASCWNAARDCEISAESAVTISACPRVRPSRPSLHRGAEARCTELERGVLRPRRPQR